MSPLLEQIKKRRIELGFKQHDMMLRVGISRQQYQRLEAKGNPRLDTLDLIAKGLKSELLLIPQEKLSAVLAMLAEEASGSSPAQQSSLLQQSPSHQKAPLSDNPWQELLRDLE